jgi:hypothetical protein
MRLILDTKSPYCNLNESKSTINVNLPYPIEVNGISLLSAEIPYVFNQIVENSTITINSVSYTLPVGNYNFYILQQYLQTYIDSSVGTNICKVVYDKTTFKFTITLQDLTYNNQIKILFSKNSHKLFGFLPETIYVIAKAYTTPPTPAKPAVLYWQSASSPINNIEFPYIVNNLNTTFLIQTLETSHALNLEEREYTDLLDIANAFQASLNTLPSNYITVRTDDWGISFDITPYTPPENQRVDLPHIPKVEVKIELYGPLSQHLKFTETSKVLINYETPAEVRPVLYQSLVSVAPAVLNIISCIYLKTNIGSQNVLVNGAYKQIVVRFPINDTQIGSSINYETLNTTPYAINQVVSNIQVTLMDNNFEELEIYTDWSVELNLLF